MYGDLGEFRINKSEEFVVIGNVDLGEMFDEMTLKVFKLQENGGRGELLKIYTYHLPSVSNNTDIGKKMRARRSQMLEYWLTEFEQDNMYGILFI